MGNPSWCPCFLTVPEELSQCPHHLLSSRTNRLPDISRSLGCEFERLSFLTVIICVKMVKAQRNRSCTVRRTTLWLDPKLKFMTRLFCLPLSLMMRATFCECQGKYCLPCRVSTNVFVLLKHSFCCFCHCFFLNEKGLGTENVILLSSNNTFCFI